MKAGNAKSKAYAKSKKLIYEVGNPNARSYPFPTTKIFKIRSPQLFLLIHFMKNNAYYMLSSSKKQYILSFIPAVDHPPMRLSERPFRAFPWIGASRRRRLCYFSAAMGTHKLDSLCHFFHPPCVENTTY